MDKIYPPIIQENNDTQTSDSESPHVTTSVQEHINLATSHVPSTRTLHNFRLIWLDSSINEIGNTDSINTLTNLRQVVNTVQTFTNVDECIDFVSDINDENTFIISSGTLGQTTVPLVHDITQINSFYIFCKNQQLHEEWVKQWSKVKGVFTDIKQICEALEKASQNCEKNSVSISFVKKTNGTTNTKLDQLDQSFMYTQLLKEILVTINFTQKQFTEFLTYCRQELLIELPTIDKFERDYFRHKPIWWYTDNSFLHSMLNRALRTMEVDLIIKMGFFVRDLYLHIVELHSEQYGKHPDIPVFNVYRGQGLSQLDFNQLMRTQGGLLSFNNFLSTSLNRLVSFAYAESSQYNPDLVGVLFEITINPSISSTYFANISDVSAYNTEEEILFSMHSIFRIGQVKQIEETNNRLWQVELTLTNDNDPQLHNLTEHIRDETSPTKNGWYRLGHLLFKLGHLDKAQQVFSTVLEQTVDQREQASIHNMLGMIKNDQGKYQEAIRSYEKAIAIKYKILPRTHSSLASSYNNIAGVYDNVAEYGLALFYYEKALEIYRKTLPVNHLSLANCYNNTGLLYANKHEYSKALLFHEKALEIYRKILPENHPSVATTYNNIGLIYETMLKYSKALSYYQKALEIRQKSLPPTHHDLAISYNDIGVLYSRMGIYTTALSCHKKACVIYEKALDPNHPFLASSYYNIGLMYDKMGAYSKALSFYERALYIRQRTLPPNHPNTENVRRCIEIVRKKL